uniref:Testis expressed 30 n=1 Tax=Scleropages formosus TaxID=113540 RepID=A0A8C9RRF3_SCLFO
MSDENVQIPFDRKHLDGVLSVPGARVAARAALVLTHGAGGDMHQAQLRSLARRVASAGLLCLRFTCRGPNLARRTRAFGAALVRNSGLERFTLTDVFLGGRSMGSRAAAAVALSMQQSAGVLRGLICLSFPLHPPGQTHLHVQRSEDLRGLAGVPVLFVSGSADAMCQRKLLEHTLKDMKSPATVHWIEGGSHGLTVKGRPEDTVLEEVNACVVAWILEHSPTAALG